MRGGSASFFYNSWMRVRLTTLWDSVRSSYWFVPSLMVTGSIALAVGAIWADRVYDLKAVIHFVDTSSGVEGVRTLLNAVAGGMIALAGVTFSITIVALSLASQQFGPRMLYNFMRDRGNQITLGTFIATFVYAIFLLRAADSATFVPAMSVTVAVVLMLAAVAVLIYFFHHVAASLQSDNVVAEVVSDFYKTIGRTCAGRGRQQAGCMGVPPELAEMIPSDQAGRITSDRSGYIQSVDEPTLVEWACDHDLMVRLHKRAGHFAVDGEVIAEYWPGQALDDKAVGKVLKCFTFGRRRTSVQDLEFGMEQLVEIAVRSLSQSINDPFTARLCVDRIGQALCEFASSGTPSPAWRDEQDRLRLITHPPDFRGIVDLSFDQIRQNVLPHVSVIIRMLEAIERTARFCSTDAARQPLLRQARLIMQLAERNIEEPDDLGSVRERFLAAQRQLRPDAAEESQAGQS